VRHRREVRIRFCDARESNREKDAMNRRPSLRTSLIRNASGSVVLKTTSTALTLVMTVVLARALGTQGFGVYAFCLSIANILTVPAMLGGQQLLVREIAAYKAQARDDFLRGLLLRFRQASSLASILIALAAAACGAWVYRTSQALLPFVLAMGLIPLLAGMQLNSAALRGLRHVLLGQAAKTLRPLLITVSILVLSWQTAEMIELEAALTVQIGTVGALFACTHLVLRKLLRQEVQPVRPSFETRKWIASIAPFVLAAGIHIVNNEISLVLLGALDSPEAVGFFRIAQRGALLIPFGQQAVNMAMGPVVAELYAKRDLERLQRMVSTGVLGVLAFALPLALGLVLGGRWLIPAVFGNEFSPAYMPLVILCLGQVVSVSLGSVGVILNMTGFENMTAQAGALAAGLNVALNLTLIPLFGPIGAAFAASTALVFWNVVLFVRLYRRTGIISSVRWPRAR